MDCVEFLYPSAESRDSVQTANTAEDHKARQAPPKKKKERAPRSVQPKITVQVGNTREPKANSEDAKLKAGALKLLGFIPLGFVLVGDATCSAAVEQALPAIADQLVALCEYHPNLKKILAPTETTGEAMAWFGLFMATSPVLLAILLHHNLLPEKIATSLAATLGAVSAVGI